MSHTSRVSGASYGAHPAEVQLQDAANLRASLATELLDNHYEPSEAHSQSVPRSVASDRMHQSTASVRSTPKTSRSGTPQQQAALSSAHSTSQKGVGISETLQHTASIASSRHSSHQPSVVNPHSAAPTDLAKAAGTPSRTEPASLQSTTGDLQVPPSYHSRGSAAYALPTNTPQHSLPPHTSPTPSHSTPDPSSTPANRPAAWQPSATEPSPSLAATTTPKKKKKRAPRKKKKADKAALEAAVDMNAAFTSSDEGPSADEHSLAGPSSWIGSTSAPQQSHPHPHRAEVSYHSWDFPQQCPSSYRPASPANILSVSPLHRAAEEYEREMGLAGSGHSAQKMPSSSVISPPHTTPAANHLDPVESSYSSESMVKELMVARQAAEHMKQRVQEQQYEIRALRDKLRLFGDASQREGSDALIVVLEQLAEAERCNAGLRATLEEKEAEVGRLRASCRGEDQEEYIESLRGELQRLRERNKALQLESERLGELERSGGLGSGAVQRMAELERENKMLAAKNKERKKALKDMEQLLQLHLNIRNSSSTGRLHQLMSGHLTQESTILPSPSRMI